MTEITKGTFEAFPIDSKLDTLFDLAVSIKDRVNKLEVAKKWSNTYAFFGGVGAAITMGLSQLGLRFWRG